MEVSDCSTVGLGLGLHSQTIHYRLLCLPVSKILTKLQLIIRVRVTCWFDSFKLSQCYAAVNRGLRTSGHKKDNSQSRFPIKRKLNLSLPPCEFKLVTSSKLCIPAPGILFSGPGGICPRCPEHCSANEK